MRFCDYVLIVCASALLAGCGALPFGSAQGRLAQGDMQLPIGGPSATYEVVHSFGGGSDGSFPLATLIDVGGTLYGTTDSGGAYSPNGTVFSITPDGTEKVMYSFRRPPDGDQPQAGLIDVSGTFYGTTSTGGSNTGASRCAGSHYLPCGTVFSLTQGGAEKVLHSFGSGKDGLNPVASLIDVNGTLYGTTENGGPPHRGRNGGSGTVFSITPNGTYKVLYNFGAKSDGTQPAASLIEVGRKLYGTTEYGGTYGQGTVFSITLSGKERVLHSFGSGTDGAEPVAPLTYVNGMLYGTTSVGGNLLSSHFCNHTNVCGTVFSIALGGAEKVLHNFTGGSDGAYPLAGLIKVKNTLYGTTANGGAYSRSGDGSGTVFSITTGGTEKVLHTFGNGTDGVHPSAGLIDVTGTLYGTTSGGGTYRQGTVFALTP